MTPTDTIRNAATALLQALDKHEDATDPVFGEAYHESAADAVYGAKCALRDSLTAAIEAAAPKQGPMKAPRTCWTCRHADGTDCKIDPRTDAADEVTAWADENIDWVIKMPLSDATPCPGFTERP